MRRRFRCRRPVVRRKVAGQGPKQNAPAEFRRTRPMTLSNPAFLLDLAFLEFDVLAHLGVVLPDRHFVRHRAGVLLGDVEKARIGLAVQPDLDSGGLRHGSLLTYAVDRAANLFGGPFLSRLRGRARKAKINCRPASLLEHGTAAETDPREKSPRGITSTSRDRR